MAYLTQEEYDKSPTMGIDGENMGRDLPAYGQSLQSAPTPGLAALALALRVSRIGHTMSLAQCVGIYPA